MQQATSGLAIVGRKEASSAVERCSASVPGRRNTNQHYFFFNYTSGIGSSSGRIVMDKKNLFFPFFMLLRSAYSHRLVYY
jgi:hypothetical protein